MKELDCLFIGSSTKDILMLVEAPPASDQRIAARQLEITCGGVSAIAGAAHQSLHGVTGVITALGGDSIYFLANEKWWRPIFYMIAVWKDIGWGTIIYIAALSGVDMEQHEAAVLDGATRFQRVIYLTLPAISGTIVTVFILNLAKVLNLFDPVWVLQNSMVINTSDVLETYVYRMGISGSQYGLSTAAGLFKSVISILLVAIGNKLSKKLTGEEVL